MKSLDIETMQPELDPRAVRSPGLTLEEMLLAQEQEFLAELESSSQSHFAVIAGMRLEPSSGGG